LKLLWHGNTDDFSVVDLIHGKGWLVGAEDLRDFRIEKLRQVGADHALYATELLHRLAEVSITECDQ
jgi:hypothetical protein